MTTISSPHNPHLQELRRLQRRRERARSGRFVAEGEDLIAAAAAAGWELVEGYRVAPAELEGVVGRLETRGGGARGAAAMALPAAVASRLVEVAPAALAAVSTLGSGTRAIGVYKQRWSAHATGPLCVYLHAVADPGNVGAVLRAAHAFGASCVALGPDCADPFSPKAVRASMGAIFHVALARAATVSELPPERVALVPRAGAPLCGPAQGPVTLLIGAEREGLPAELTAACERVAHIPIAGDSLNAAMAATVALYEMHRGWRSRPEAGEPGPSVPTKGRRAGPTVPNKVHAS
ncbi:MAG TPA: RNA methyltransferase [Solirubrobacteraceae bacterium]|nr:RNA methyltransferase [Solirubrobacteraceae bacterium]